MKKRIVYILAVVLVVSITAVALVSCTGSPMDILKDIDGVKEFTLCIYVDGTVETATYSKGNIAIMSYVSREVEKTIKDGKEEKTVKVYENVIVGGAYHMLKKGSYTNYVYVVDDYTDVKDINGKWYTAEFNTEEIEKQVNVFKKMYNDIFKSFIDSEIIQDKEKDLWFKKDSSGGVDKSAGLQIINGTVYYKTINSDGNYDIAAYYKTTGNIMVSESIKDQAKENGELKMPQ